MKYCTLRCKDARPVEDVPNCHTYNPIYCKKYDIQRNKLEKCLDDIKEKNETLHISM